MELLPGRPAVHIRSFIHPRASIARAVCLTIQVSSTSAPSGHEKLVVMVVVSARTLRNTRQLGSTRRQVSRALQSEQRRLWSSSSFQVGQVCGNVTDWPFAGLMFVGYCTFDKVCPCIEYTTKGGSQQPHTQQLQMLNSNNIFGLSKWV